MNLMRVSAAAVWLLSGCTGTFSVGEPDPQDSGIRLMFDAGPPTGTDAGPPTGTDAGPAGTDAGPPAGTDAGPPPPCGGAACSANAHCDTVIDACVCDAGFAPAAGGGCVMLLPGDPAGRTEAEVCAQWTMGHVENSRTPWTAGPTMCDPGTMDPVAIDDTLRRLAMFRWLAGLGPVEHDASRFSDWMECAHMMTVNNQLSHTPPATWTCYASGGASAAGSSNIALGSRTPGAAIDLFMFDRGVMSLGHRRWILKSTLGSVQIGFAGRAECLGVFGGGARTERDWTAFPNQGVAPLPTAQNTWSFHANTFSVGGASATVQRVSDGADLPVSSYLTGGGGPPPTVGFTPMGWTPVAGETYRVTISGTSMGDIVYETTLVSC